jgi:hypothetical protein
MASHLFAANMRVLGISAADRALQIEDLLKSPNAQRIGFDQ